jgi:hypothetical protein
VRRRREIDGEERRESTSFFLQLRERKEGRK